MEREYASQAQGAGYATQQQRPSFGSELDNCIKRLHGIHARLEEVGQRLTGPTPEVASPPEPGRPITSIGSRLSDISQLLNRVEHAAERIAEVI